jgi:hypothetical protein
MIRLLTSVAIGRPTDVYFCQDCGGASAANAATCRICGRQLVRERNGAPCHSCGAPTVDGASFCSLCGAAAVAAATLPAGQVLAGSRKIDSAVLAERQATVDPVGSTINLGEGLDLPDWLKRAAAEQPFDATHQSAIAADPFGPPSGTTATLAAAPPAARGDGPSTDSERSSRPPLSIPTDAPSAMSSSLPQPAPASDEARHVAAVPAGDVSDTSTFISENDLPEWIRQLAAADEAKKAEELRRTTEAANADRLASGTGDARQRRPLPGETPPSGPATSPWLTRRDRPETSESVAADSWGAGAPAPAVSESESSGQPSAQISQSAPTIAPEPAAAVSQPLPAPAASAQPNRLRVVLLAAVVLVVVALIAFMALS